MKAIARRHMVEGGSDVISLRAVAELVDSA